MKPKFQLFHYLIAFALVVITAVTTALIMNSSVKTEKEESRDYLYIDPNARDIDESVLAIDDTSGGQISYVTISGSEYLFIEDGLLKASPLLCNKNKGILMQIAFEYNGQVFFKTGLIPSKKGVADIELPKHFQPGIYDIKLKYEFYAGINEKITSTIEVNVKLVVR